MTRVRSSPTDPSRPTKGDGVWEREWEPGWINLTYGTDWLTIPHQWFIVEHHTCTSPHRSRRPCQIRKDQERLTAHLGALCRDDIDHFSVRREKRVELGAQLLFVDPVIQVVDIERRVWLDGRVHFGGLWKGGWAFAVGLQMLQFPRLEVSSLTLYSLAEEDFEH